MFTEESFDNAFAIMDYKSTVLGNFTYSYYNMNSYKNIKL